MNQKLVVVLAGGRSPERAVSERSGQAVRKALEETGFTPLLLDPARPGFTRRLNETEGIYAVFLALHGPGGEDGIIQGFLETIGLPYTGSGVSASSLAINKALSKKLFISEGIPVPPFVDPDSLPLVVKPVSGGSTLGITVVREKRDLEAAVSESRRYDHRVFMEKFIPGTEITVSILGNDNPRVLPSIEIVPAGGFYDYQAKYLPGGSRHIIPPRLPEKVVKRAEQVVLRAHNLLGCRGFSRGEVIVSRDGQPWLLELNTIPGLTETSLFPDAALAAGISFNELVVTLLALAREKNNTL